MKRFFAILLALAMIFSMSITAFAEGEGGGTTTPASGTITITNATIGETYSVYKIFDATYAGGDSSAVSYSLDKAAHPEIYNALFGNKDHVYFLYNESTGNVTKHPDAVDAELVAYLTGLAKAGTFPPVEAGPQEATRDTVTFAGLDYGYYIVLSTLGATATLDSNTPYVEIIDKNQTPGGEFSKQVWHVGTWSDVSTAGIGDKVSYKISFEATNYFQAQKIKYYQILDEKGDAIWVDFQSFHVKVNGQELKHGYYLDPTRNYEDWTLLGDWEDVSEDKRTRDNAQWYLVHLSDNSFRVTIPWLEGHTVSESSDVYSLVVDQNNKSLYSSPVDVEITYDAGIEADAVIGGGSTRSAQINKANVTWTCENESETTAFYQVRTDVYGIGVLKDDGSDGKNLQGATFRLYSDESCTQPIYLLPTNTDGVYIVDSIGSELEKIAGDGKQTSRAMYGNTPRTEKYLANSTHTVTVGETLYKQDNYAVSQVNGKLIILGLNTGNYYLKEVKAPEGYNALTQAVKITADDSNTNFAIYVNANGEVKDIQTSDGIYNEVFYLINHTTIHNNRGIELPSTGGAGTVMLITMGTILACGFAVLMITQKKMSIYKD